MTKFDAGNQRMYCKDRTGNNWVIVNVNTSRRPFWVPHDHTNDGEPCSPIRSDVEWCLVSPNYRHKGFYQNMSHKVNTYEEFEKYCVDTYNANEKENADNYLFYEAYDRDEFIQSFGQVLDLKAACDQSAKLFGTQ